MHLIRSQGPLQKCDHHPPAPERAEKAARKRGEDQFAVSEPRGSIGRRRRITAVYSSTVVLVICRHVVSRAAHASALNPITSPLPKACYLTALRAHSTGPIAGAANGSGPGTATWLPRSLSPERFFGSLGPDQLLCNKSGLCPTGSSAVALGTPPRESAEPAEPPACRPCPRAASHRSLRAT
jgi:hypothetical protein